MNRRQQIADQSHVPCDSVRREAYERAMNLLNNRAGIGTRSDSDSVRSYNGPLIAGRIEPAIEKRR